MRQSGTLRICGNFDLAKTLDCGQCFSHVLLPDGSFRICFDECAARVWQTSDELRIDCLGGCMPEETEWARYFSLDTDYAALDRQILAAYPADTEAGRAIAEACAAGAGIRLLRQDPWEALASFIVSQNNNIPRIRKILAAIRREAGRPLAEDAYSFPDAQTFASRLTEEKLRTLGAGFRAPYLVGAARAVADGRIRLASLAALSLDEAMSALCELRGVGIKVASCALLYGGLQSGAFPMDVWMKRANAQYFGGELSAASFGPAAGLAQQYIFCYIRKT